MEPTERAGLTKIKPPDDVIAELSAMTSESLSITKIKEMFYKTLVEEYLDGFTDVTERMRNASKVVLASLASKAGQNPEPVEFKIFDKTGIKVIKKTTDNSINHLAQVYGIGAPAKADKKPKLATLMLWGKAAQLIEKFIVGSAIKFGALVRETDQEYSFALFDGMETDFKIEEIKAANLPTPLEAVRAAYKELSISDVPMNISLKGEIRLVRGRVASGRVALSKKNNNVGHLNLINPASTLKDVMEKVQGTGFHVTFNDAPEMATRHDTGSDVDVLCVITNDPQYGLSGLGKLIIPIFSIPKKPESPKPPQPPATTSTVNPPTGAAGLTNW